tara:strand:- start:141 stop:371 length:231 start_codon:yes stop_codon:yes gene_type:complete
MDLIRKLTLLNHQQVIQEEIDKRYPLSETDSSEDVAFYESLRDAFTRRYDKANNRQFVKTKMYHMDEYRLPTDTAD